MCFVLHVGGLLQLFVQSEEQDALQRNPRLCNIDPISERTGIIEGIELCAIIITVARCDRMECKVLCGFANIPKEFHGNSVAVITGIVDVW